MGDAITKGKGTPWGPMETGRPDQPVIDTAFMTDPSQIAGRDQTAQRKAMRSRVATGAGRATEQALASLGRAGVQGSDQSRALADIAGGQAGALGDVEATLEREDTDYRTQLMNLMNQAKDAKNRYALQKYGMDESAFEKEQQGRGDFYGGIADLASAGLGSYFGAKAGRKK